MNLALTALVLLVLATVAPAQAPQRLDRRESNPFYEKLKSPWQLYRAGKQQEAAAGFRAVLEEATTAGDRLAQAWSHYGLGEIRRDRAEYPAALEEYTQSLKLYESLQEEVGVAFANSRLGSVAYFMGNASAAREHYRTALEIFRRLGLRREQAGLLGGLAQAGDPEGPKLRQEQLSIAREVGDKIQEAAVLHDIGDGLFIRGKFDSAQEHYTRAAAIYQQIGDKENLARVRTSEGRLHRAHGHPETALDFYREALGLQEEAHDRQGQIQTIDAMAVAYSLLGQSARALSLGRQALALAKQTGSERIINFEAANLAAAYIELGRNREAVEILEPIAHRDQDYPDRRFGALSEAYFNLGRFRDSREAAVKSEELARARGDTDYLPTALIHKARIESKLGQQQAALTDAQECLRVIEEKRAHLVPNDFMKLGFAETTREAFEVTIRLLADAGQAGRALEVAEQARSRAFLDLLATRDLQGARGEALAALREIRGRMAQQGLDPSAAPAESLAESPDSGLWKQWNSADPELRSLVAVPSIPVTALQDTARRLNSTILSYWVARDATYIWIVPPAGEIRFARAGISERQLKAKIKALWPGQPGIRGAKPVQAAAKVTMRGGEKLAVNTAGAQVWRDLYRLLIRPVERWLPSGAGELVTVEAHGPLLMLPFSALQNEQGQYLIERFTLHSIPAVSLLQFTQRKKDHEGPRSYLLVADPAGLPQGPGGKPLPALPGARREISSVARLMPASASTVLQGKDATEQRVAELAGRSTAIHLATHGVIREDDPLGSFLALSRTGSGAAEDGALTTQQVYGLELHANLVFLSACRSGLGQLSGDGINGLTRAFLYAGTPSVIASLWDVADETAGRLVTSFYRAWLGGSDKARALRSAQLRLLRALRAGQVSIRTPYGPVAIPEDPVFWASFVLQGEP